MSAHKAELLLLSLTASTSVPTLILSSAVPSVHSTPRDALHPSVSHSTASESLHVHVQHVPLHFHAVQRLHDLLALLRVHHQRLLTQHLEVALLLALTVPVIAHVHYQVRAVSHVELGVRLQVGHVELLETEGAHVGHLLVAVDARVVEGRRGGARVVSHELLPGQGVVLGEVLVDILLGGVLGGVLGGRGKGKEGNPRDGRLLLLQTQVLFVLLLLRPETLERLPHLGFLGDV